MHKPYTYTHCPAFATFVLKQTNKGNPVNGIYLYFFTLFWYFSGIKSPHAVCTLSFHTSAPASSKQDFYQILGVPRTATQKEIKKAYYQVCSCLTYCTFTACIASQITNRSWQCACVCCPSDGQKVSPRHQQRWPTSQGKICSAGRSLWGLVSFFIPAFTRSAVCFT